MWLKLGEVNPRWKEEHYKANYIFFFFFLPFVNLEGKIPCLGSACTSAVWKGTQDRRNTVSAVGKEVSGKRKGEVSKKGISTDLVKTWDQYKSLRYKIHAMLVLFRNCFRFLNGKYFGGIPIGEKHTSHQTVSHVPLRTLRKWPGICPDHLNSNQVLLLVNTEILELQIPHSESLWKVCDTEQFMSPEYSPCILHDLISPSVR